MRAVLVSVGLLTTLPAFADDAAYSVVGSAGAFVRNEQIRMVSEDVLVELSNRGMHVVARFDFRNEGKATTVTMAFPDSIRDYKTHAGAAAITRFRSSVDGRRVNVTKRRTSSESGYSAVWTKSVPFKARQSRRVVAEYWARHGDIGDYIIDHYVLRTGATWKGKIGKARITVDWSALNNTSVPRFEKASEPLYGDRPIRIRETAPRRVEMMFYDFEPDFNIEMSWVKAFWNYRLNGKPVGGSSMPPNGRGFFVGGDGRDPTIDIEYVQLLFDEDAVGEEWEPGRRQSVSGRPLRFEGSQTVCVGNRKRTLRRRMLVVKDRGEKLDGTYVYVRDLVRALGGEYRYDPAYDRASIRLP